jgi:putative endonuclease
LQELKSFSQSSHRNSDLKSENIKKNAIRSAKGTNAEALVIKHFKNSGADLVGQRFKTPFAEVDLLFEKSGTFYMVEVKKADLQLFSRQLIGKKQLNRLRRAFVFLQSKFPQIKALLAIVSQHGVIQYIDDFL